MRLHETTLRVALVLSLFLSACTGGSDDVAAPTAEPVVETPTVAVVEDEPTPTPEPDLHAVTEQDRIDVVVAAFDAAIQAGEAPESLIAYDLLDSSVNEDVVTLNICGWTGDTVFDTVRESLWRTSVEADGSITATHITSPLDAGDCINTHLIETALATIEAFDEFFKEATAEPELYVADERVEALMTSELGQFYAPDFADWSEQGLSVVGARQPGSAVANLVTDLIWRTYTDPDTPLIEFVLCRDMVPERGLYRDGVLIDDGRSEGVPGLHSIDALQLRPDTESPTMWRIAGRKDLIWSDCLGVDDWPAAASSWKEGPVPFEVLRRE